ncbi:MAG: Rrf2 family transcriptional regulator, partial [Solirubrobacterales bacterium]|nr:Rrf2 family transcriptional regulator [Solirubrobacterales bacterium]
MKSVPSGVVPVATRGGGTLRVTARADYALRAAVELAVAHEEGRAITGNALAQAQGISPKFLETILAELRFGGIVRSQRGVEGGYWLARPPAEISIADVIRGVEGPLASVRGKRPEDLDYRGSAKALQGVWIAVRHAVRDVVEHVTLADLAAGELPAGIAELAADPDA